MTASMNGPLGNRIVHGTVRSQPLAVRQNSMGREGRERHNDRIIEGLCDSDGFFVPPAAGSRCIARKSISTVLAGQRLGIKEVDEGTWLVSFIDYDLGYIDLQRSTLQTLDNPFGPRL